jgi:tetratricopeptide (TPR) repeat protein
VQLVEPQDIELKGETKAMFGGNSKSVLEIELPMGTQEWYYAFTNKETGQQRVTIGLKEQVEKLLAEGNLEEKNIEVPQGNLSFTVYLLDEEGKRGFMSTQTEFGMSDYPYFSDASITSRWQGVKKVEPTMGQKWYLGLKNPNSMENAMVHIEVVAVVSAGAASSATSSASGDDEMSEEERKKKAELFGSMAEKKLDAGDLDKALEYINKSASYASLGAVEANRGMTQLLQGKFDTAMETYVDAIVLITEQSQNAQTEIQSHIDRLEKAIAEKKVEGAEDVLEILRIELE